MLTAADAVAVTTDIRGLWYRVLGVLLLIALVTAACDLRAVNPSSDPTVPDDFGIIEGLFVASPEDLAAWDTQSLTPSEWPAMEFRRISSVELGTLESILTGVPYDKIDQEELHALAQSGGEEGPWVIRVRPQLVSALADLRSDRVADVARSWSETDEFSFFAPADERLVADLTGLVATATDLARIARERGQPMWLVMSL